MPSFKAPPCSTEVSLIIMAATADESAIVTQVFFLLLWFVAAAIGTGVKLRRTTSASGMGWAQGGT